MSQEWDIDNILASLDELLEEGKGDATSKEEKSSSVYVAAKNSIGHIKKDVEKKPDFSIKQEKPVMVPVHKKGIDFQRIKKVTLQAPKHLDIDVPDANFRQEPNVDGYDDIAILPRVVLTQDMMVEAGDQVADAFSPLLDAMDDDDEHEAVDEEQHQPLMSQEQDVHLNGQQVAHVLELVSKDISDQFKQLLPDMIRQSLHTHLNMMEDKQVEQQNNQKNEKA